MAKIKFGAIVTDIRGSIDSVTYSRSRYGAYARKKVTPVNPATSAQTIARSAFGAASSLFRSLGAEVVDAWNQIAPDYSRSNIFGDNLPLSGSTLFTKLKTQLLAIGVTADPSPIAPVTVPEVAADEFVADISAQTLETTDLSATDANQRIAVYATAPVSGGKSFFARSQFRLIKVKTESQAAGAFAMTGEYEAVYGSAIANSTPGQKIGIMLKYVDIRNGQSGAEYRQTVVLQA